MASLTHTTTDHDEIRTWVEEHDGVPATVRTEDEDEVSILRIDFPGGAGEDRLRHIEWDAVVREVRPAQAGVHLPGAQGERRRQHVLQARRPRLLSSASGAMFLRNGAASTNLPLATGSAPGAVLTPRPRKGTQAWQNES